MPIKIEKKMPIPKRMFYDNLAGMKKGDSFTFPETQYSNLRNGLFGVKKRYPNRLFKTRIISATRRRVWRTK